MKLLLFFIVIAIVNSIEARVSFQLFSPQNYCNIESCYGRTHTACIYTSNSPAAKCGNYLQIGLTDREKKKIVHEHNKLRQKVARGREKLGRPGPQPPAKYMPMLEWDDELAYIAQKWANQCNFGHDSCRDTYGSRVGQNVAYIGTTNDVKNLKVENMVKGWYDEVKYHNRNNAFKFTKLSADNGKPIGHYTQMVWSKTTKIGCGAMKYKSGPFNNFFLVCNYSPAGNWLGEPVY